MKYAFYLLVGLLVCYACLVISSVVSTLLGAMSSHADAAFMIMNMALIMSSRFMELTDMEEEHFEHSPRAMKYLFFQLLVPLPVLCMACIVYYYGYALPITVIASVVIILVARKLGTLAP